MQKIPHLTVATYNIQFSINPEKIIANISQMANDGVDIFCLQEIINIPNEEFIIDKILKMLGDEWKAAYHVGNEFSRLSIGTAILWKPNLMRLKHKEKILLPKLDTFDLHEKLYYRIIGVPGISLQRRAISCLFAINQKELRVTSVHIDNVGGPKHRSKQVAYLMNKLKTLQPSKHEIIAGDFNTFDLAKTGYEKKLLQKIIGMDFIDVTEKIGWTADIHNADFKTSIKVFPWFINTFNVHVRRRLDYIWVKNFGALECEKQELSGSDHFPVVAKLELR